MVDATIKRPGEIHVEHPRLGEQLERLEAENARLRSENRQLRAALDAHVRRAQSTSLFGPVEMSPGTCTGPRRRSR